MCTTGFPVNIAARQLAAFKSGEMTMSYALMHGRDAAVSALFIAILFAMYATGLCTGTLVCTSSSAIIFHRIWPTWCVPSLILFRHPDDSGSILCGGSGRKVILPDISFQGRSEHIDTVYTNPKCEELMGRPRYQPPQMVGPQQMIGTSAGDWGLCTQQI